MLAYEGKKVEAIIHIACRLIEPNSTIVINVHDT
jgi:hypothetical protein